jgi:hypothetical protein
VIVSVCADKGAPGATTLATVLGMVWPGLRVVLEADTAGSDLSFRLRPATADSADARLASDPSIVGLATAARLGLSGTGPLPFVQDTSIGVPVVTGALSAERFRALRSLWPGLAQSLAGWPGTVIADLGRLQHGAPAAPLVQASTAVLVVTRADLAGLYHLRDQVVELAALAGTGDGDRVRVGVVVTAAPKERRAAVEQVRQVLASIGSPAPVLGAVAFEPAGAQALWAGVVTRRLAGSELVRSARSIAEAVLAAWPSLTAAQVPSGQPEQAAAAAAGVLGR